MTQMHLRELKVGCFGGGTGLPSLLGGLKNNPWVHADAVVTMFDSGGSSGVLRDELGVLPPGDILKCALALADGKLYFVNRTNAVGLSAPQPRPRASATQTANLPGDHIERRTVEGVRRRDACGG